MRRCSVRVSGIYRYKNLKLPPDLADKGGMKHIILALAFVSLSSCASMAPISYYESCAVQGMKLGGVSQSSGTTVSYANVTGYGGVNGGASGTGVARSYGDSVNCLPPESDQDRCEIQRAQTIARPRLEYNSEYRTKYFLSGLGYWLFILPGVVAKVAYDDQLSKAEVESQRLAGATPTCSR